MFINTLVKFSNFMSWSRAFDSLFCSWGRVFVHDACSGGKVFAPFAVTSNDLVFGMVIQLKQ